MYLACSVWSEAVNRYRGTPPEHWFAVLQTPASHFPLLLPFGGPMLIFSESFSSALKAVSFCAPPTSIFFPQFYGTPKPHPSGFICSFP